MMALNSVERRQGRYIARKLIAADACLVDKAERKRENERLRSEITCRKWKQTRVQTLFLPCCHLVACEECNSSTDDCIMCSDKILATMRTFLI